MIVCPKCALSCFSDNTASLLTVMMICRLAESQPLLQSGQHHAVAAPCNSAGFPRRVQTAGVAALKVASQAKKRSENGKRGRHLSRHLARVQVVQHALLQWQAGWPKAPVPYVHKHV